MTAFKLFLFMCGQVGIMLLARFLFQWLPAYAAQDQESKLLYSAVLVGALMFGFRLFDAVTDPLAGIFGDWWVKNNRKRQNLLLCFFAFPIIGLVLIFFSDFSYAESLRWLFLTLGLLIFFIGYTLYVIPLCSLVEDYSQSNTDNKKHLSNMLGLGLMLATVLGFIVSPVLVEHFGFANSAMLIGALAGILMLAPVWAAPQEKVEQLKINGTTFDWKASLALVFKDLRFLRLIAVLAGAQMAFTILTALAPFIATRVLGGTYQDVAFILGPLVLTAIPAFIFTPRISSWLGWEKCLKLGALGLFFVSCLCLFIGADLIHSPIFTASLIFAVGGPFIALILAVEGQAVVECAKEADRVSTYFGLHNFIIKALNGLALFFTMLMVGLDATGWGLFAIKALILICCVVVLLGYMLFEDNSAKMH